MERFSTWVSAYYQPIDDLETLTPADAVSRSVVDDPTKLPTISTMSSEEIEKMTDFGVLKRSHDSIRRIRSGIYARNLRLAFGIGKAEEEVNGEGLALGETKVVVVWCSMTMVDSVWAAKTVHGLIRTGEADSLQKIRRQVALEKLDGANHFVSYSLCNIHN